MRVDNWPDSRPDNSNYYIFDPVKYIKERVHYFRSHITPERNSRELPCYHMDNPIGLTWLDWSLVGDKCHVFLYLRINIWFLCFFNCFFLLCLLYIFFITWTIFILILWFFLLIYYLFLDTALKKTTMCLSRVNSH
jgi:hypothetical protein